MSWVVRVTSPRGKNEQQRSPLSRFSQRNGQARTKIDSKHPPLHVRPSEGMIK